MTHTWYLIHPIIWLVEQLKMSSNQKQRSRADGMKESFPTIATRGFLFSTLGASCQEKKIYKKRFALQNLPIKNKRKPLGPGLHSSCIYKNQYSNNYFFMPSLKRKLLIRIKIYPIHSQKIHCICKIHVYRLIRMEIIFSCWFKHFLINMQIYATRNCVGKGYRGYLCNLYFQLFRANFEALRLKTT